MHTPITQGSCAEDTQQGTPDSCKPKPPKGRWFAVRPLARALAGPKKASLHSGVPWGGGSQGVHMIKSVCSVCDLRWGTFILESVFRAWAGGSVLSATSTSPWALGYSFLGWVPQGMKQALSLC